MNLNINPNQNSLDQAGIKSQLKNLGDQIESIAKQLKGLGNQQDIDELYELGDKVQHFCDDMNLTPALDEKEKLTPNSSLDLKAGSSAALDSKNNLRDDAGLELKDASIHSNQTGQKNQDEEMSQNQKPNPVM